MNCVNFIEALVEQGHKVHCSPAVLLPSSPEVTKLTWGVPRAETTGKTYVTLSPPSSKLLPAELEANSVYLETLILISRHSWNGGKY